MKNKKIGMYVVIVIIILIVLGLGYLVYINLTGEKEINEIMEYTPEEEITDEQIRMTNIELFFLDKENNIVEKEIRSIDAKKLLEEPAKLIIEELLKGPDNKNLFRLIPENTKINSAKIEKGILYLDFSEEFINQNIGEEKEHLLLESIKKSMEQLLEINSIKILINNQEDMKFNDSDINFSEEISINS